MEPIRVARAYVEALIAGDGLPGRAIAAVLTAVRARVGVGSAIERGVLLTAHYLHDHAMLDNLVRVESFGMLATGQEETAGRAVLYVKHATEAQRAFCSKDVAWPHSQIIFIDLCDPDDLSYVLAEIAELREVYGVSPRVIYPVNAQRLEMVLLASAVELGLVAGF